MRLVGRIAFLVALLAAGDIGRAEEPPVRVVLTRNLFWLDEAEDVERVAQLIGDMIGREIKRTVLVEAHRGRTTDIGKHLADIRKDLEAGKIVVSDGLDFVRLKLGRIRPGVATSALDVRALMALAVPRQVAVDEIPACTSALVVTSRNPRVRGVADLRGKRLIYSPRTEWDFSMLFLETLVRRESGGANKEEFFESVRRLSCDDACFITLQRDRSNEYVTCIPDIVYRAKSVVAGGLTDRLQRVEASEPYAAYACFYLKGKVREELVKDLRDALLALHEDPRGSELLTMIKVDRFLPFAEEYTEAIEELVLEEARANGDRGSTP